MSSKSMRRGRKQGWKPNRWKVIDDHSGFVRNSDDVMINHRGYITSKANYDPIHYSELPIDFPVDEPIPFSRSESADVYSAYTNPYNLPATYLDTWYPQTGMIPLTEMTPSSNPNMNFNNNLSGPVTFGNPFQNSTNTVTELPTTGTFQSWGDSYNYTLSTIATPYKMIDDSSYPVKNP